MNKVICTDCIEGMKQLEDNSIDSIVTDPPYDLTSMTKPRTDNIAVNGRDGTGNPYCRTQASKGFMGKQWDGTGIAFDVNTWKEAYRILKPGGYLLSFGGTRTYHRMASAIEDANFEIRDIISWNFGSGFPKSLNVQKQLQKMGNDRADEFAGVGTALKPAHEMICMARKPLAEKTVAENCLKWGTGGINIDESRVGTEKMGGGTMPDLRDVGAMSKEAIGIDKLSCGQNPRPALRKEQSTYEGRFPSNFIHDNSPEVLQEFEKAGVSKSTPHLHNHNITPSNIFDGGTITKGEVFSKHNDSGTPARFFKSCEFEIEDAPSFIYTAKASKSERNAGCEELANKTKIFRPGEGLGGQQIDAIVKNSHPTVKPIKLMEYLVKLVTPKNGICLDPFMGSGTTAVACKKNGFKYLGFEKEAEYIDIINARLSAVKQTKL